MSVSSRRKEESNPFFCDDDEEDSGWGNSGYRNKSRNQFDEDNGELERLQQKIHAAEDRSLDSLRNTSRVLAETEDIGNRTAEELLHQGEQLNNTEEKLDSISRMTKVTQRNINSLKSVFGGIKNWFQQKNETPAAAKPTEVHHSRLRDAMNENRSAGVSQSSSSSRLKLSHPHKASRLYDESDGEEEEREDNFRDISRTSSRQAMIDEHLSDIGAGVSRLKELSLGMNDELNRQDAQLSRLMEKTEANSDVIGKQNSQMRGILG